MNLVWEEIVVLAGEGGRVTLLGSRGKDGTWNFIKKTDEAFLVDILDGERLSAYAQQESRVVTEWADAFALLGPSWIYLHPRVIHPEFRQRIWKEILPLSENIDLDEWERLCLSDPFSTFFS